MGSSTYLHLSSMISVEWCDFISKIDYVSIAVLVTGSTYPVNYYVFACDQVFLSRCFYLGLITLMSLGCAILFLIPKYSKPEYRPLRGYVFIFLGLSAAFPFFYINYLKGTSDAKHVLPIEHGWNYLIGGLVYIGGALLYVARFPER